MKISAIREDSEEYKSSQVNSSPARKYSIGNRNIVNPNFRKKSDVMLFPSESLGTQEFGLAKSNRSFISEVPGKLDKNHFSLDQS